MSSLTPDLPRCQSVPWGQHGSSAVTVGLASCQTLELVAVSTALGPGRARSAQTPAVWLMARGAPALTFVHTLTGLCVPPPGAGFIPFVH